MSRPERMYIYIYNHNAREGQLPDLEVGGVGEGAISPRQKNCKQNMGMSIKQENTCADRENPKNRYVFSFLSLIP